MTAVSVVIPVYNEQDNITPLTRELWNTLTPGSEIILVDDHSTDNTWHTITRLSKLSRDIPVRGYRLETNRGQSAALQAGLDHTTHDIIVTMDGDGQNDPRDIPHLLDALDETGASCAYGYREHRHDTLLKTIPSKLQTILLSLGGPDVRDYGCGMKAIKHHAINDIQLYGEHHRYIPFQLNHAGYEITEVPLNHRKRKNNTSKYGIMRLYRGFLDYAYWMLQDRYQYRPLHWLGGTGLIFSVIGVLIGLVSVVQKYIFGVELGPRTPRLVLVALLVVVGLLLFCFGFIAESITELQVNERGDPYHVAEVTEPGLSSVTDAVSPANDESIVRIEREL